MIMYKIAYVLFCAIVFIACNKEEPDCEPGACTEEFRSLYMRFTDKDGKYVNVKDYSAVNMRTGERTNPITEPVIDFLYPTFIVANDSYTKRISMAGDEFKVTGTYEATGQTKSAIIKISGGKCACHIEKLSGPEKIVFD